MATMIGANFFSTLNRYHKHPIEHGHMVPHPLVLHVPNSKGCNAGGVNREEGEKKELQLFNQA